MMPSLRTRLLMGTIGGMLLLLTCFSLVVYAVIRQVLLSEFDRSLASTIEILAAGVEIDADRIEVDFAVEQMPQFNDPESPALYQIWELGGRVIARSPLLGTADLPHFHSGPGVSIHRVIRDPRNGLPLRAVGVEFSPRIDEEQPGAQTRIARERPLVMVAARDARSLHSRLNSLRWLLLGTAAGTAGLALLAGAVIVRRGLRPLQSIAAEIAAIDETALEAHIGSTLAPAEIVPIQDRLNSLLARLKEAFERERRFSANVAHELRNPLAGMRSTVEVALTRDRDNVEYRHALSECLGIIESMQAMVNNLLLLARMDADQMVFHMEDIVLSELVDSSWEPFSTAAREHEIAFDNRVPGDLTLTSDRQSFLAIFSNLLSNAVEYADHGSQVWTQAQETDGSVDIVVANTGCRLGPDQAARVFDRFWRADPSRSAAGTHCGLGLSLVHRIVQALGGSISATIQDSTFILRLRLPCSNPR